MRNRTQIFLLLLVTVLLTAAIVTGITMFSFRPKEVTIATGPVGTQEQMFAVKLQKLLVQNMSTVRVNVVTRAGNAQAVAELGKNGVDLAVLRTDAKIPAGARAVALLERDLLLRIEPKGSKSKSISDLRGKKIAVLGEDGVNEALIRGVLDLYEINGPGLHLVTVPPASPIDKLLAPGNYNSVMVIEAQSRLTGVKYYEDLARQSGGFTLGTLAEAKAIARKISGLQSETIDAGLISSNPRIPDEDADTLALDHLLVARGKLSDAMVVELARNIFENKSDLALPALFATHIEPPSIEKDAYVAAHGGVIQYVDNDVKTFLDRYSDWIYLSMYVASIVGSLGFTFFAAVTRITPKHAHEFAEEYLTLADKIRGAGSEPELNEIEVELRENLRAAVRGLKSGSVSPRGLDAFRLCYDHAREAIADRRALLRSGTLRDIRAAPSLLVSNPDPKGAVSTLP